MNNVSSAFYLMEKYKDRLPVIIEKNATFELVLDNYKYLLPKKMIISEYIYMIRNKIKIKPAQALFMLIKSQNGYVLAPLTNTIEEIYNLYRDKDGFLYITFKLENTFG